MTDPSSTSAPDLRFWFDPGCPFAWMTSTWVRAVRRQRDYDVEWRFISLLRLNAHVDYDRHFPPEYRDGHTAGARLLRVAAAVREAHGNDGVDRLYASFGHHIWDGEPVDWAQHVDDLAPWVSTVLGDADLPTSLAAAVDDATWDAQVAQETDEALALCGKDVGTPIIQVAPPDGVAFFGPVISRRPSDADAVELWDHVVALANHPGFAELKRSLRERPQLEAFGTPSGEVGQTEDWHAGSRRQKK